MDTIELLEKELNEVTAEVSNKYEQCSPDLLLYLSVSGHAQ